MSENLKRLREETIKAERRFEYVSKRPKEFAPSQINETIRALNKAREEEQRVKEEIKETEEEQKSIVKRIINAIDSRRGDEARDASTYFNLAREYNNIPTASRLFQQLSDEEDKHSKLLRMLADELERQIKQL